MPATGVQQDRYFGSGVHMNTKINGLRRPNRVLMFGGSWGPFNGSFAIGDPSAPPPLNPNSVTEWDNMNQVWVTKGTLRIPRVFLNATILPNGTIFIVGGSSTDPHNNDVMANPMFAMTPVLEPELYDPQVDATPNT
jgi:hypothetical protein